MPKSANASVSVTIGAALSSTFGGTFRAAAAQTAKIGAAFGALKAKGNQLESLRIVEQRAADSVQKLTGRLDKQREAAQKAEARVASLKEKIAATNDPTGRFAVALDRAEQQAEGAKTKLAALDTQLHRRRPISH